MSKFKKVLSMALVVTLTAAIAITGTMAYLTSTDSDVNVMTLGGVEIEQLEYQRVVSNDGTFATDTIDDKKSYVLEPFEQAKPLYPSFAQADAAWDTTTTRLTQVGSYGGMDVFENALAQDKFVFVKNTGKSDAYVRTIIAFEAGSKTEDEWSDLIGISYHFTWNEPAYCGIVNIDGNNYEVVEFVYKGWEAGERHVNGVLPAGEMTYCNLAQVYMKAHATNEDCEALDGNNNGTYDILVLSQAIQAAGFSDAQTALDTGFGSVDEDNVKTWFSDIRPMVYVEGNDKDAVMAAINKAEDGYKVVLTEDVTIAGYAAGGKLVIDKNIVLDLNGYTMTTECGWGGIDLKGNASIINGTINHTGNTAAIKAFAVDKIENVTINVTKTADKTKGGIVVQDGNSYVNTIKNVTINGATNGIQCYRSVNNPAIGTIDNVKINATANGIWLDGAGIISKISNCEIEGGNIGINANVANLWHISLNIENSKIIGGTSGIDIWDEEATNTGSTVTFNYDDATDFEGGTYDIKVTLDEEITCTINGAEQAKPCAVYINN